MESDNKAVWAIGMMSGTSMDGIDAALIKTDGSFISEFGPAISMPYDPAFREHFKSFLGKQTAPADIITEFTRLHVQAVKTLLAKNALSARDVSLIGFHGQTLFHDPANGITVQVGDGQLLANETGINVIADFRKSDVASGGEGAPFAPLYHQALARDLDSPLVVLNLGGVANITYINGHEILAFDTGPASAMIDDWMMAKSNLPFDEGGALARSGNVENHALEALLDNKYFDKPAPKSLDRDDFSAAPVQYLSAADGAATLTEFTVQSVAKSLAHLDPAPRRFLVTGGGRHNNWMMERLAALLSMPVDPVETVGWRGDELEAEAFAFLAVRSARGLPLSLPTTTGVSAPTMGGALYRPVTA